MPILIDQLILRELVHDHWFDLTKVEWDKSARQVTVHIGEDRQPPYRDRVLRIFGVVSMEVRDEARIQFYDIGDVIVENTRVRIVSNFPCEICIDTDTDAGISLSAAGTG